MVKTRNFSPVSFMEVPYMDEGFHRGYFLFEKDVGTLRICTYKCFESRVRVQVLKEGLGCRSKVGKVLSLNRPIHTRMKLQKHKK